MDYAPRSQEALRNAFLNGCIDKRPYPTAGAALRAQDRAMRNGKAHTRNALRGVEPYPCRFCGQWHLGHNKFAATP